MATTAESSLARMVGQSSVARAVVEPAGEREATPRWTVFVHQDGILLSTTIRALAAAGVLAPSLERESSVEELVPEIGPTGFGYLRVGLRCLASQGWLDATPTLDPRTTRLRWTPEGRAAAPFFDRYVAAGQVLAEFAGSDGDAWSRPWTATQSEGFSTLVPLALSGWRLTGAPPDLEPLIRTHLDSALVVPAMLAMCASGAAAEDLPGMPGGAAARDVGRLLRARGWIGVDGAWTPEGRRVASLAVHFGMAASYLPLLARLPALFGGAPCDPEVSGSAEWHVNRELNVSASGAAHTRYFDDAEAIFCELFDREPVDRQPRFIADMGCGDGSWLVHLHRLVTESTLRGRSSAEHPLLMVGLDYNEAALSEARRNLEASGVPALLVRGDVSDPDGVRALLAQHGLDIADGLHIRAFIDHNRSFAGGDRLVGGGISDAAYIDPTGAPVSGGAVESDLAEHLRRWAPHIRRHGLVMLEAHCVAPRIARRHLGATHSVAFDAYHGYSKQYPVEHAAFQRACEQAGLRPATERERRYPATRPFVAVSLNHLIAHDDEDPLPAGDADAARADTWAPPPELSLEDGRGLHDLLYEGGDVRFPRLWCSAPTGYVVARTLERVEQRLATAMRGEVVRVLDYGAGTGLASLELLKACKRRAIDRRMRELGVEFQLHLADLPSGWFAQGYALLRGCSWTRFHSLAERGGGFRPLGDVTGEVPFDAVMANMVFHLIPPTALELAAAELAEATRRGGVLAWSAPDLAPRGAWSLLFHDANRALRARWLEHIASGGAGASRAVKAAVASAPVADSEAMRAAAARAARRVLPEPNAAEGVTGALGAAFGSAVEVERPTYELPEEDVLRTLLVPSNVAELLAEITDSTLRERAARDLMQGEVMPALRDGPAGTAVGLNVQWTLGAVMRAG